MQDLFARIGIVFQHLLDASTVHGPAKEEAMRLISELSKADFSVDQIVNARVNAIMDALTARMAALEDDQAKTRAVTFSTGARNAVLASTETVEEHQHLESLFNGAAPAAFDHDKDGKPGGSEPKPPTADPNEMTVAQAKEYLDGLGIPYPSTIKKDELIAKVKSAMGLTGPVETSTVDVVG